MWPFTPKPKYMTKMEMFEYFAAQGIIEYQFKLGLMYEEGKNVPRNRTKGIALLEAAAEQGAAFASNTLSTIYIGSGDISNGLKWLRRAAEQGLANAQAQLGIILTADKITERDDVMACAWLAVAEANDCPNVTHTLKKHFERLTPSQKERVNVESKRLIQTIPKIPFNEHVNIVGLYD